MTTPEAELNQEGPVVHYAPWMMRAMALITDVVLLLPFSLAIWLAVHNHSRAFATVLQGLLLVAYAAVFQSRQGQRNGQTLGQQWLHIRVIRDSGKPLRFWTAAARQLLVTPPFPIEYQALRLIEPAWLIDYLWPLWDRESRALHDIIVKTHVVVADASAARADTSLGA